MTDDEFFRLEEQWRSLFSDASYPTVFASWEWVSEWWRHFSPILRQNYPAAQLHIVCVLGSGGEIIGIAPFYEAERCEFPFIGKSLRLIGEVVEGDLSRGMTEEPAVLLRKNREEEAVAAMLAYLTKSDFARWNHFFLPFLSAKTVRLARPFLKTYGNNQGPQIVRLPKTWADYRNSLSRSMRDNLAYYPKRLAKHGHSWNIKRIDDPDQITEAADLLVALHRRRAAAPRGCPHIDHIPAEVNVQFLKSILRRLTETHHAFITVLEVNGKPVAAQMFLQDSGTLTVYYSGYDITWYDYSPLTLLLEEVIRQGIKEGIHTLNFLRGELPWKTRWRAQEEIPLQRATNYLAFCQDAETIDYLFGHLWRKYLKRLMTCHPSLSRVFHERKRLEIESRQGGRARLVLSMAGNAGEETNLQKRDVASTEYHGDMMI